MNAAAAHAAFVMTVSAARMYWLLRHAQHARDINIRKLNPLPEKIGLGSVDFLHSGTGYIEIAMFVLLLIFLPISVSFQNDFNHENRHSATGCIEEAVFVPRRFQSRFQSRFPAQWNTPLIVQV